MQPVERAHLFIKERLFRRQRDPGRRAEHVIGSARPHHARAHAGAGAVSAADDDGSSLQQPCLPRRFRRHAARRITGSAYLRQQALRNLQRREHLLRPGALFNVEQIGARSVAVIGDEAARQLADDKILGVQHLGSPSIDLRLVFPHPHQLCRRIGRAEPVPRDAVAVRLTYAVDHLFFLRDRARIRPDDGSAQRVALRVHRQAAHHLPAEGDAEHLLRRSLRLFQQFARAAAHRAPPIHRVLLHKAILRRIGRIIAHHAAPQRSVHAVERGLVAAGTQIVRQNILFFIAHDPSEKSVCLYI